MLRKEAFMNQSLVQANSIASDAKSDTPNVMVQFIEQEGGLWTVLLIWNDDGSPVDLDRPVSNDHMHADAPVTDAAATADAATSLSSLGALSARFESKGAADIGRDKNGGFSYGTYQIATKPGTMQGFLRYLQTHAKASFDRLNLAGGSAAASEGTEDFKKAWVDLAGQSAFAHLQHDFIASTHYGPLAKRINDSLQLDVATRSNALRNVVWSVAVQHGVSGGERLFERALLGKTVTAMDDEAIIKTLYKDRSDNVSSDFAHSTPEVQASVAQRFVDEEKLALHMLA